MLNTAALWGVAVSVWRICRAEFDGTAADTARVVFLGIAIGFYAAMPFSARWLLAPARVWAGAAIVVVIALASAVGYAGFVYYAPSVVLLALIAARYEGAG